MKTVRLLIAEDQRLFRQSVRCLLEREPDIEVVAEAIDGREAFNLSMALRPDIVLMDVDMPTLDGITATRLIQGCTQNIKILMLSIHDDDNRIVAAVQAGASGYILKDADHAEFLRIIRGTLAGEEIVSPFLPDRGARTVYRALAQGSDQHVGGLAALTHREREILAHAAGGGGNKEIADQLCVSADTVKTHLHHIYQKLHVTGRVEAILLYLNGKELPK